VQDTRADERSLAVAEKPRPALTRAQRIDLDDIPIYASTGTHRIPIGQRGFWIEIKQELDFGEQTILDNASVIGVQREQLESTSDAGQTVRLDLTRHRFLLCAIWLVGWSLPPDEAGKSIRFPRHVNERIETIKALNPHWGDIIVEVITEHIAAVQEADEVAQRAADEEAGMDTERGDDDNPPGRPLNGEFDGTSLPSTSAYSPAGVGPS
jgi:hypothetical protein